jgi:cell division protein FtsW
MRDKAGIKYPLSLFFLFPNLMAKRNTKLNIDYSLLLIVLGLLVYGLIVLYSASTVESFKKFGNTTYYIYHQLTNGVLLGLVGMFICAKIDYHFWQKRVFWLICFSLVLLFLVKVSSHGLSAGGASRWLQIGGIMFQPSEIAKLTVIIYLASWIDKKRGDLRDFYFDLLPSLIIVGLFAALILWQPDLGTMLVLIAVSFAMLFAAGINWKYVVWSLAAMALSLYGIVKFAPYRSKRLTAFFDPGIDPKGISYHISQALLAVGSGSLWGYGYGLSRQKYNYLPEAMGDSVFAIAAEELGFLRILAILILFCLFALKGYSIAKAAPDLFGKLLAFGITSWVAFQALINIGAMVNLIPLTGIPLPFFSYGSTSLAMNLASIGILLNISRSGKVIKIA